LLPEAIHSDSVTSIVFGCLSLPVILFDDDKFSIFSPITFETRKSLSSFSRVERINGGGTRRLASHHPLSIHFHLFLSLFSTRLKRARNSRITRHTHSTSLSLIFYLTVIIIPHHRIRKKQVEREYEWNMEFVLPSPVLYRTC
jgi:hypothetical protein